MKAKPYKSNILATCIALSLWGSVQAAPGDCNDSNLLQRVLELSEQVQELRLMLKYMLITQNDKETLSSRIEVATRESDYECIHGLSNITVLKDQVEEIIQTSSFYLLKKAVVI